MDIEGLKNTELQEKLKSAKTPDDLVALAKEEGIELTDDQIEAISGGWDTDSANDRSDLRHLVLPIY